MVSPDDVTVAIPWRAQPGRVVAFEQVRGWYADQGFTVVSGEAPHRPGPFNLAAARNHLMSTTTARVVVLSDADTLPELPALWMAIQGAGKDGMVHLPYHLYRVGHEAPKYVDGATSGIYVTTHEAWESTGGQDEQFEGWGYEDSAWRLAHLTLNGPIIQHHGIATAFEHPAAPRDHVHPNRKRFQLYQEAYGNPEMMEKLVRGIEVYPSLPSMATTVTQQERTAMARARIGERRSRITKPYGWR